MSNNKCLYLRGTTLSIARELAPSKTVSSQPAVLVERDRSSRRRERPRRKTADGDDGRGSHPEGAFRVLLLEADANLESVGEADPVQRLLHVRQHAHRGPVLRFIGPADPLHDSAEASAGIAEKVHLRLHARLY